MGHPFAASLRSTFETWFENAEGGGLDALKEALAEDVVWHQAGDEEPLRGRDAVLEAVGRDMGDLTFDGEIHTVLADDEHAIALIQVSATRGDRRVSYGAADIVHHRDGKITERWTMVDDFPAVAAFWSD